MNEKVQKAWATHLMRSALNTWHEFHMDKIVFYAAIANFSSIFVKYLLECMC